MPRQPSSSVGQILIGSAPRRGTRADKLIDYAGQNRSCEVVAQIARRQDGRARRTRKRFPARSRSSCRSTNSTAASSSSSPRSSSGCTSDRPQQLALSAKLLARGDRRRRRAEPTPAQPDGRGQLPRTVAGVAAPSQSPAIAVQKLVDEPACSSAQLRIADAARQSAAAAGSSAARRSGASRRAASRSPAATEHLDSVMRFVEDSCAPARRDAVRARR